MKILMTTLCLLLLLAQAIVAQEKLTPNQPVSRNLDAGKIALLGSRK